MISWIALLACCSGETDSSSVETASLLARGGWVEEDFHTDLRGYLGTPVENPLLWRPLPLIGIEGGDPAGRGWRPVGGKSVLSFWYRGPEARYLVLELRNRTGEANPRSFELEVELNGRALGSRKIEPGRLLDQLPIPAGLLATENRVELGFSPSLEPDPEYGYPIALLSMGFSTAALEERTPSGEAGPDAADGRSVRLAGSGTYVVPLMGLEDLETISFEVEEDGSELAVVSIERMEADGTRRLIESLRLGPREPRTIQVPIEQPLAAGAALLIHSEVARRDGWLAIRGASSSPAEREVSRTESALPADGTSDGSLPDVILIILDAARGDRFPGWQYPRRTMPNIDRLASSARVFRKTYAECPTTSCSIPALLTGV
ncbi:MAG: sulfatase-like hydrolase/transferase, partial [Acidobacteriota bacterium]